MIERYRCCYLFFVVVVILKIINLLKLIFKMLENVLFISPYKFNFIDLLKKKKRRKFNFRNKKVANPKANNFNKNKFQ